jgi:hypothetical protein
MPANGSVLAFVAEIGKRQPELLLIKIQKLMTYPAAQFIRSVGTKGDL